MSLYTATSSDNMFGLSSKRTAPMRPVAGRNASLKEAAVIETPIVETMEINALKDALLEAGALDFDSLDQLLETSILHSVDESMDDVKLLEEAALFETVLNKTNLEASILMENSTLEAISPGDISNLSSSDEDDEKHVEKLDEEAVLLEAALIETKSFEDALVEVAATAFTVSAMDECSSDEDFEEYLSKKISSKRRRTKKPHTNMETIIISRNGKKRCMDDSQKESSPSTCICGGHNGDDWIGCNGKSCVDAWFHLGCVGLSEEDVVEMGYFYCFRCVAKYE